MELREISETITANQRAHYGITGRYFRLLANVNPITVEFGIGGRSIAKITNIDAGISVARPQGKDEFTDIWITTSATEAVKAIVSDGEVRYDVSSKQWYDRSPVVVANGYNASVAAHSVNTRWTYTVPSGKKFMLQQGFCQALVTTAGSPAAGALDRMDYTPSGGSTVFIVGAQVWTGTQGNNSGPAILGGSVVYLPGDVLAGKTSDQSTGSTVNHCVAMGGLEFNAGLT